MVASALQSSRPLYRVIGRSGAVVRADVELDSAQVGDLVYGAVVVAADASVAKTSAGVSRRRIVKPVGGYVSSRVLRPLSSDEVDAHRRAQDAAAAEARAAAADAACAALRDAQRAREAEAKLVANAYQGEVRRLAASDERVECLEEVVGTLRAGWSRERDRADASEAVVAALAVAAEHRPRDGPDGLPL